MNNLRIIAVFMWAFLSGCTLLAPTNETRVTEYSGTGMYMTGAGQVYGCRVTREEDIQGCLRYEGERCTFYSKGCITSDPESVGSVGKK